MRSSEVKIFVKKRLLFKDPYRFYFQSKVKLVMPWFFGHLVDKLGVFFTDPVLLRCPANDPNQISFGHSSLMGVNKDSIKRLKMISGHHTKKMGVTKIFRLRWICGNTVKIELE